MVASLEFSVVRIYKQRQTKDEKIEIVGAGFLVSLEYVITCAHVVNESLGFKVTSLEKPTQIIECDFPLISPIKSLETTVEVWLPVKFNSDYPQDIAILKLKDLIPTNAKPVSLITSKIGDLFGHSYKAYGFSRPEGVWSDGEIKGTIACNKIQMEDTKGTGYAVESGFSGTAIWDSQLEGVVGMAVMADKEKLVAKSAFFIPTNVLLQAWEGLVKVANIKGQISEVISLLRCVFENKIYQNELELAYKKIRFEIRNYLVDLPQAIPLSLSDFIEIIYQLDEGFLTYPSGLKFSWLEILIGYLILQFKPTDALANLLRDHLKEWLQRYQPKWEILINVLHENQQLENLSKKQPDGEPCLFVTITEENKSLMLRAWIVKDINNYNPTVKTPKKRAEYESLTPNEGVSLGNNLQENELIIHLKRFKQESEKLCQSLLEKVQLFLPYRFIEKDIKPIDLLVVDEMSEETGCEPSHWGTENALVIRFSERITMEKIGNKECCLWIKKCKLFRENKNQILVQMLKSEEEIKKLLETEQILDNNTPIVLKKHLSNNDNPNKLLKYHRFNSVIGSRLTNLSQETTLELKTILAILYEAGIPLALWIRPEAVKELNCQEKLDNICKCQLEKLPEIIKGQRAAAWLEDNHIGNHLSLLLDDYHLIPPNYPLFMP